MSFVDIIIVNDKHKKNNDKISKRKKTFEEKEKEEKEHLINVQYEYHEYLGIVIKLHSFKCNDPEINMDGIVKTVGQLKIVEGKK